MLVLKKLLSALLLPPTSPLLLIALGLVLASRTASRRRGLLLAALGGATLLALSLPPVAGALSAPLQLRADPGTWRGAQAVVVLGGGLRRAPSEYGGDTLSSSSLERLRYGVWLARQSGLPLLLSGGVVFGGPPEARVMAEVARGEYALSPRWVEEASRDTRENARLSARLLAEARVTRVLLVTSGEHSRRAVAEFRAAGLDPLSAPTAPYRPASDHWSQLLPSARALAASASALHEWLGLLAIAIAETGMAGDGKR